MAPKPIGKAIEVQSLFLLLKTATKNPPTS
jgi:hypothetical protein